MPAWLELVSCIGNLGCLVKGTLQAKYEFTSVYRAVHDDFSSAVHFLIRVLVYEILLDMLFIA